LQALLPQSVGFEENDEGEEYVNRDRGPYSNSYNVFQASCI